MQSSLRFDARDSGIELLRIIAMFVIQAHYFVVHNDSPVNRLPFGPTKLFMHFFLVGSGKAAVVVFFCNHSLVYARWNTFSPQKLS